MSKSDNPPDLLENALLAALPPEARARLTPALESVTLKLRDAVYEAAQPIEHVFFPTRGVISLVSVISDGAEIEVATVGREGCVGLPVFLGSDRTPFRAFCQVPGQALRMPASLLREAAAGDSPLCRLLDRYALAMLTQVGQSAVCNRIHSIDARCARWLLLCHDRMGADEFLLTHAFLGEMLGVRRAGVTEAAGRLQQAGLIRYRRGRITIADRPGLEGAACECYRVIRDEYDRLLGDPFGPTD